MKAECELKDVSGYPPMENLLPHPPGNVRYVAVADDPDTDFEVIINPSGIRCCEYNVLVKPTPVEAVTKGKLIIPVNKIEKDEFARMEGTLVAVSRRAFTFDGPVLDDDPKVGDRVVFSRYQATELTGRDGEKYWMMKDRSIAGVIENG